MRKNVSGFTLIQLVVTILILVALSIISVTVLQLSIEKSHDAERQSAVKTIPMMIMVDGASDWKDSKYKYSIAGLRYVFRLNDYKNVKAKNNICYIYGSTKGANTYIGDDNEFVFMTWGETTSTWDENTPGVLVSGTDQAVKNVLMANLSLSDFSCDKSTALAEMAFEAGLSGLLSYYLGIDENGDIIQWGANGPVVNCSAITQNNCVLEETISGNSDGVCAQNYAGTCDYDCYDGTWTEDFNHCVLEVNSNCIATTDTHCILNEVSSGSTAGTCDTGYLGSCLYSCTDSIWSLVNNSCILPDPTPPVNCSSFWLFECFWNWTNCEWTWWWGPCTNR